MTITATAPPDAGRLTAVLEGLANLSAFLETHPGLPLGSMWSGDPFLVYAFAGTDEENRAEVDQIAAILGVTAGLVPASATHYTAVRQFGGGVTDRAIAIDSRFTARAAAGTGGTAAAA